MQTASALVKLANSPMQVVSKTGITPAELIVLRYIHGEHSVSNLKQERSGLEPRPNAEELNRLQGIYKPEPVAACFPGGNPRLPKNFRDIGINIGAETKKTLAIEEAQRIDTQLDENDELSQEELDEMLGMNNEAA